MKTTLRTMWQALVILMIFSILCGIVYTGTVTGLARLLFQKEADGSILTVRQADGTQRNYGSVLIAQQFSKPEYLIGRPFGTTNLSPSGKKEQELVRQRTAWWHAFDPSNNEPLPSDLVTASGSGVDPNISPAAAEYQVRRIARTREIDESDVRTIIRKHTSGRFLGVFGEPAVNVLEVNLALDGNL